MNKLLILTLVIFSFSCVENKKKINEEENITFTPRKLEDVSKQNNKEESVQSKIRFEIDYDNVNVLNVGYVINRYGAEIKQTTSNSSKTLLKHDYGERVDIIENENDEWFAIRERIRREYIEDGMQQVVIAWEKVYVSKNDIGSIEDIKLLTNELKVMSYSNLEGGGSYPNEGHLLEGYIDFEIINQELFEQKCDSSNLSCLVSNETPLVKKENGILQLICKDTTVIFQDNNVDGDYQVSYKYVGSIDILNSFVVLGSYWESSDYRLIDKDTGKEQGRLDGHPFISTDNKHIISIYANVHDPASADLSLFEIENRKVKNILFASFKNWLPDYENASSFWNDDGYFYQRIVHTKTYGIDGECQYIRMKLLN